MTSKMAKEQFERLEETIKKGRRSFVLKNGILLWGLPVGIIVSLWNHRDMYHTVVTVLIFCLVGYFGFGPMQWYHTKKQYEKQRHDMMSSSGIPNP